MNFIRILLVFLILNTHAYSNENIPVKYIDLKFVINNSIIGKKIKKIILNEGENLKKEHQKLEKNLENKKNEILSKKNILNEDDFKKEVDNHQKNVADYQKKQKKDLNDLSKKNLDMSRDFMIKVDKIIIEYAKLNSIDLLLKKEALIVSNSNLDITKNILIEVDKKINKID